MKIISKIEEILYKNAGGGEAGEKDYINHDTIKGGYYEQRATD